MATLQVRCHAVPGLKSSAIVGNRLAVCKVDSYLWLSGRRRRQYWNLDRKGSGGSGKGSGRSGYK